jgi:serine/threonine protein kinase/tetratricopeptide (TPR) repeat protein
MAERNDCPDAGRWQLLLEGNLPEEEKTNLDQHLEACELCQQTVDGLVADQASWSDMARHLSDARPEIESAQNRTQCAHRDPRAPDTALDIPEGDGDPLSFLQPSNKPESLGRLGHYEILEVLGRGGMGIVLRAFDDKLHRVVAIKVMAPALAATSPPRKRFLREARAAARVRHEHVIDIHAVEEEPIPYLVMEYVPGENLQQKLDRVGPLEVPEVLRIGEQVARGLAAAHAQGLIHRDIKPANILLQSGVDQVVKITDFGLARAADDASLTQSGMIAGTPMYMAPEQAQGETTDHRADLFSLGSVLYTMCTGRPPFRASTSLAVLKRVAEDTPRPIREIIPEVPPWLCDIIAKLQAKKPEDRYQSAAEAADLLGRCLAEFQQQGQVVSVGQAASLPETAFFEAQSRMPSISWARRKRRWAWAAALALLLLGGLSFTEATGVTNVRATVIRIFTGDGTLIVEANDPAVKVTIEGDGGLVITGAGPQEVRLRPGSYKLQAAKDGKPVRLDQELVTITRGDRQVVRVAVDAKGLAEPARTFVTPWSDSNDWVVEGQELVQPDTSWSNHLLFFGDPSWTDYNFEAEAKFVAPAGGNVLLELIYRASGRLNRLHACLLPAGKGIREQGERSIRSWNGKVIGIFSPVPGEVIIDHWYRMRVEARGNRFRFVLDGKPLTSAYIEGFPRGCVGLSTFNTSARFRNLKVTDPDGKVLFEGVQNVLPKWKSGRAPAGAVPPGAAPPFVTPWLDSDDWAIEGKELVQRDSRTPGHLVLFGDPGWADYNFEGDVKILAGDSEVGLVFRARDPRARLYAMLGGFGNTRHGLMVNSKTGAGDMRLVPGKTGKNRWYRVRVEARGNTFKMFLDGKLLTVGSREDYPRGCVGLVTGAKARFRNLKVTDPSGKVLLEGVPAILPKAKDVAYREVGAVLQDAVRLKPHDAEAHFALGSFYAQWGEWKKASAEYDRGLELNPTDYYRWCHATVVRLAAGDLDGYRRTCRELAQRYGDADDQLIAERVVNVSLLLPNAVTAADFERVQKLAVRAITGSEKHGWYRYYMRAKALADYRAGRYASAVKWLEQSAPKANGNHDDALMFAILSMAQHGLGRTEDADAALAKMRTIVAKMPDPARGQPLGDWHTWLIVQTVCREADELMKKK